MTELREIVDISSTFLFGQSQITLHKVSTPHDTLGKVYYTSTFASQSFPSSFPFFFPSCKSSICDKDAFADYLLGVRAGV